MAKPDGYDPRTMQLRRRMTRGRTGGQPSIPSAGAVEPDARFDWSPFDPPKQLFDSPLVCDRVVQDRLDVYYSEWGAHPGDTRLGCRCPTGTGQTTSWPGGTSVNTREAHGGARGSKWPATTRPTLLGSTCQRRSAGRAGGSSPESASRRPNAGRPSTSLTARWPTGGPGSWAKSSKWTSPGRPWPNSAMGVGRPLRPGFRPSGVSTSSACGTAIFASTCPGA